MFKVHIDVSASLLELFCPIGIKGILWLSVQLLVDKFCNCIFEEM